MLGRGARCRWPHGVADVVRFPQRLSQRRVLCRGLSADAAFAPHGERLLELFQKGYVKGTVTTSAGNEATAVGMTMPLRPGRDVVSLLHRDFAGHLLLGATPHQLFCQYMANAESPTHAREGNAHHGDAARPAAADDQPLGQDAQPGGGRHVGGTPGRARTCSAWPSSATAAAAPARFHESLNVASVQKCPCCS